MEISHWHSRCCALTRPSKLPSKQTLLFPRLCFFSCLAPWPRPLPPGLSTLINGSWLGDAWLRGNDKYPSRMASQSSNSYLKDSYHPEEIHQLYFIAMFFTLYFISIPLFRKRFKCTPSLPFLAPVLLRRSLAGVLPWSPPHSRS